MEYMGMLYYGICSFSPCDTYMRGIVLTGYALIRRGASCLLNGASCLLDVGQVDFGRVFFGASCLGASCPVSWLTPNAVKEAGPFLVDGFPDILASKITIY